MIVKTGEKLIRVSVFLEKEDVEIFKKYGLIENVNFPTLIRKAMSKDITSFKMRIKKDEVDKKQI